jgi:hypothetical protein
MSMLVPVTLFGWVPGVLLLFLWLPPRRAVIAAFIGGFLFLPSESFHVPGIPDFSRTPATSIGVLFAVLAFDFETVASFRFRWFDLPMIVWCLCPFATNATEDIDIYDSFSWVFHQMLNWGIPYFLGRVYITDTRAIRELAIGVFIGGLVYIPICLFEIRMAPQLSKWVYGIDAGASGQRLGGWRPAGFLGHGLMLGMWMTTASLTGIWLWFTGSLKRLGQYRVGKLVAALLITTIMCKSTGALAMLLLGLGCLFSIRYMRIALPFVALCLPPVVYPIIRADGLWDASQAIAIAQQTVGIDRAKSLQFRIKNENRLAEKALHRFWFGWGRFGRSRVLNENGKDISTTDGLWIITLGMSGVTGLAAVTLVYLLPGLRFWWRSKAADWSDPSFAAIAVTSVILVLYSMDNILNAMLSPVTMISMGAVIGVALDQISVQPEQSEIDEVILPLRRQTMQRTLWPPPVH